MFGDSTAMMTALGLNRSGQASGKLIMVPGSAELGCGVGRGGERRSGNENDVIPDACNQWATTWADTIRSSAPDLAVVQIGPWEVSDRRLQGDDVRRSPVEPVYDTYLLNEMTEAVDVLSAGGAHVIWLTAPPVGAGSLGAAMNIRGVAAEPERTARLNGLIHQIPDVRPGQVTIVDLSGWLEQTGEDTRLRPDGVHFGLDESTEVADRYLADTLIEVFDLDWSSTHPPTR